MSRMTAAQVISLGEYLQPEFEPTSLTVSQLLGVLGYHNIPYPTPYTKAKLVHVFNNEVKTRATKFKRQREKNEGSAPSEDGITDGITGKPLSKKAKVSTPLASARRTSRRLSQAPADSSPTRTSQVDPPDALKRRRSSAQPNIGGNGNTKTAVPVPTTLTEESEPEEEALPAKKVSRTKKQETAGTSARRVSHVSGDDSGWEDNNIFQSGAESSSPAKPSPVRKRVPRVSVVPRQARKSTSAPPSAANSSPVGAPIIPHASPQSPIQSPFRPSLPPTPYGFTPPSKLRFTPIRETSPAEVAEPESPPQPGVEEHEEEEVQEEENNEVQYATSGNELQQRHSDKDSEIDEALAQIISENASNEALVHLEETTGSALDTFGRTVIWFCIVALTYTVFSYKVESSSIGFCDRGSNTSHALDAMLAKWSAIEACTKALPTASNNSSVEEMIVNEACPLPPLFPLPHPNSCTPCPDHATCSQFSVTCDPGYLLKPHILLSFVPVSPSQTTLATAHAPNLGNGFLQAFSSVTSGFPGFGSVGLPPRCLEDPQRKRNIGALGKAVESMLGKERGRRVCRGERTDASEPQTGVEAAVRWGLPVDELRKVFRENATPSILPVFDDMFNEAIQQLSQWGGVFMAETPEGVRYVAHKTPEMTWDCVVIVKTRELWAAWRSTVLVSISMVLLALGVRLRVTQKQKENRRIAGLVQVALDTLRNQEMAHYTDPLTAPQPYLSSIQLRDVVLQEEHSVPTRRRLWERVERVVESNANVRTNLEEIEGGDETRVWRWVGSAGTGRTPGRKEIYYEEE